MNATKCLWDCWGQRIPLLRHFEHQKSSMYYGVYKILRICFTVTWISGFCCNHWPTFFTLFFEDWVVISVMAKAPLFMGLFCFQGSKMGLYAVIWLRHKALRFPTVCVWECLGCHDSPVSCPGKSLILFRLAWTKDVFHPHEYTKKLKWRLKVGFIFWHKGWQWLQCRNALQLTVTREDRIGIGEGV